MKKILLVLFSSALLVAQAQQPHQFSLSPAGFLLDGKPIQLISGELHPARIPVEYWRHRIQMVKAMGCNTVAAYVFWNYHETKEGEFDFSTGNRNLKKFIQLCQEEGMWVLIRPGPYVCAEWDFGGLPPYLLRIPDIKVRCMDPRYMKAVNRYVDRIAKEIVPLQCNYGGPVLMLQIENEYGSYGNDRAYLLALQQQWKKAGIKIPFYTADGPTPYMLEAGSLPDAAIGLDSGSDEKDFEQAFKHNPNMPSFSSETYPGWLTHWGEKWAKPDTNSLKKEVDYLLKNRKSFNFYVIHGGTNFGFTAGANASSPVSYQPDITSYDYDAPINERGEATPKFHMLRNMIATSLGKSLPPIPAPPLAIQFSPVNMQVVGTLWDHLTTPIVTAQPKPFEYFGQNQGMVLYQTTLTGHKSGRLKIWEPHDYALVFLNGKFIDTVFRDGGNWEVLLPKSEVKDPLLEIWVEGMGHINFAQYMIDRKGITDRVTLNGMTLMNWKTYLLPLDEKFVAGMKFSAKPASSSKERCHIFKGVVKLDKLGDVYVDLRNYTKGMVYVNGHLLGRYWNIGPQQRLFCPASWLQKGNNEIMVIDLLQQSPAPIEGFNSIE